MRLFSVVVLMLSLLASVRADEFEVSQVIHPSVAKLAAPKIIEELGKGQMAITTSSDLAARHFSQGLAKLNTIWEFESYRHFCEVVKLDPECLMGYWGISLSLGGIGQHEFFSQRKAAVDRMLDLLEAEKEEGKDRWNVMETGFVQAAGYLLTNGPKVAGRSFQALARKYPANIQAHLFSLVMQRDGFDNFGKPRFGQRRADEGFSKLLKQYPDNPSVMTFWVNTKCQNPVGVKSLREEVLPVARKLAGLLPDYPPFQIILSKVELRCGNFQEGLEASTRALELYRAYMEKEGVTVYDCDGLVRAQLFRAHFLTLQDKKKEAIAIAKELSGIEVKEDRVFSKGAAMLMWQGRTLGARLMVGASTRDEFLGGQDMMTISKEENWFKDKSFAIYYRNCLASYLAARGALSDGKVDVAKKLFGDFQSHVSAFEKTRSAASQTSSYNYWLQALGNVSMLLPELRGLFSELGKGASKEAAATWFRAALDRQTDPVVMMPPEFPYPMEWRMAEHYAGLKKNTDAASWYLKGLEKRPNHRALLSGLSKVADKLGKTDEAAALRKQIEEVTK